MKKYSLNKTFKKKKESYGGTPKTEDAILKLIRNDGQVTENGKTMSLQCFWISIRDWFKNKPQKLIYLDGTSENNENITVSNLKEAAGCGIGDIKCNGDNEMTELDNKDTHNAIENLAIKNNILIRVFYSKNDKNKLNISKSMLNNKRHYDFGNFTTEIDKQIHK